MSQDAITLTLEQRNVLGKAVKHLRRDGKVPAVIHDHGKPSLSVMADYAPMFKTYQQAGKHHAVELTTEGKKYTAIIKSATFEPRKNRLSHVVFNAVNRNEKVEAEVPIHPRYAEGNEASPAERASLLVISNVEAVAVEATAANLPDFLEYDAEKLVAVGDHVTVADLTVPSGVTIKTEATTTIASVYEPSAVAAANDAAGGDADADAAVPSDHESGAEEGTQAAEDQPGGNKQKEPKGE